MSSDVKKLATGITFSTISHTYFILL